jgi:hypothetical protein
MNELLNTVSLGLLDALRDRGYSKVWLAEVTKSLDEDGMWHDVIGPLLDRLQQGDYHHAGPATDEEA